MLTITSLVDVTQQTMVICTWAIARTPTFTQIFTAMAPCSRLLKCTIPEAIWSHFVSGVSSTVIH